MGKLKKLILGAAIGAGIGLLLLKNKDKVKEIAGKTFHCAEIKLGKYRDEKGILYEVIGVGKDTEHGGDVVIYKALERGVGVKKDQIFVLPKGDFKGSVDVDGEEVTRFTYVGDEDEEEE